ncbi:MAG: AAA family ATPase [Chthoniobacterales bacterium]
MSETEENKKAEAFRSLFEQMREQLHLSIIGQNRVVDEALIALFAGGHVLLEGVPGLGKTLMVRSIADCTGGDFSRIQFTPDLMPADITGTNLLMEDADGKRHFEFQPGPVFSNLLLADEINRATPKTQSALLEAMQEGRISTGGVSRSLEKPFLVFATQNPIEMEGTYPLPEAQVDRFMFKILVPFPTESEVRKILSATTGTQENKAKALLGSPKDLLPWTAFIREIIVSDEIEKCAAQILLATHPESPLAGAEVKKYVRYGVSPRGGQALLLGAKVEALLAGRFHVAKEDLKKVCLPALRHRILLNFEGEADEISIDNIINKVVESILD